MAGVDIGGAFTLIGSGAAQSFDISAGATDALLIDPLGRTLNPNQIGFNAGFSGTDPGWVALPAAAWTRMTYFNNSTYNKGGGYAASRFTAPVAGAYLFHCYNYFNKASSVQGNYTYSTFYVNGVQVGGTHNILGHFQPVGYSFGTDTVHTLYLAAGDYVDHYIYSSAAGTNYYRMYGAFGGFLVG
jgi:hypothetical protein